MAATALNRTQNSEYPKFGRRTCDTLDHEQHESLDLAELEGMEQNRRRKHTAISRFWFVSAIKAVFFILALAGKATIRLAPMSN